MSLSVNVTVTDTDALIPRLATFVAGLRPSGRVGLNRAIGAAALQLTRAHLIEIGNTRHDTAKRLGASPTGHWSQAAEKTKANADANGATITIKQPGIGRAAHDVTIVPKDGKKFLTLPNRAEAYGKRARRAGIALKMVWGRKGPWALVPKDFAIPKGEAAFSKIKEIAYYILARKIDQKQDRTLLPSDAEYRQATLEGARDYVAYLLQRAREATR